MDSTWWRVGDIVSRHGSDEQRIIDIDQYWGTLRVVVTKSCGGGCCPLDGEWEDNLIRRYEWVRAGFEYSSVSLLAPYMIRLMPLVAVEARVVIQ